MTGGSHLLFEAVTKRFTNIEKQARLGDKKAAAVLGVIQKVKVALEEGRTARSLLLSDEDKATIYDFHLITIKPVVYVANLDEKTIQNPSSNKHFLKVEEIAKKEGSLVVAICGAIESEIASIENEDERKDFLNSMGLEETGLDRLIRAGYDILGLITYFTAGEKEVRAWTINVGDKAPAAAGKIHGDFEKGFIKAEVVGYDDYLVCGTRSAARDKGKARMEGKEYTVQDGDVIEFKFNV
jgi:GTP-binding protein YchF